MFDLTAVQAAVRELGLDGWLLYDFRGLNVLARRVLGLGAEHILSRRWFYYVPAEGEPRKLVHQIEPRALDAFPGKAERYLSWQELEAGVGRLALNHFVPDGIPGFGEEKWREAVRRTWSGPLSIGFDGLTIEL